MKKLAGVAVAALMTVTALSGCGGDDSSSSGGYCDDLKSAKESFIGLTSNSITQDKFESFLSALHNIRDEAPSEVKDDWTTFSSAADNFNSALGKAGFTMDDLAKMQSGEMGSGADMQAVMKAAQSLGSTQVADAQAAISAQVKKDCGVDLNSDS